MRTALDSMETPEYSVKYLVDGRLKSDDPIPRRPAVGDDNAVIGTLFGPAPRQSDLKWHSAYPFRQLIDFVSFVAPAAPRQRTA